MLRTALEVVAGLWAVSGLGVAIWAAYELRRPGLSADGPAPAPAPATEASGTHDADRPVGVVLPGEDVIRHGDRS